MPRGGEEWERGSRERGEDGRKGGEEGEGGEGEGREGVIGLSLPEKGQLFDRKLSGNPNREWQRQFHDRGNGSHPGTVVSWTIVR